MSLGSVHDPFAQRLVPYAAMPGMIIAAVPHLRMSSYPPLGSRALSTALTSI